VLIDVKDRNCRTLEKEVETQETYDDENGDEELSLQVHIEEELKGNNPSKRQAIGAIGLLRYLIAHEKDLASHACGEKEQDYKILFHDVEKNQDGNISQANVLHVDPKYVPLQVGAGLAADPIEKDCGHSGEEKNDVDRVAFRKKPVHEMTFRSDLG
jgi:hypothetical protein